MKLLKRIIPFLFLLVSIIIMEGGVYFKKIGDGDKIPAILNEIEDVVYNDDWEEAENKVNLLVNTYNKVSRLVQFSAEREALMNFKIHLFLLKSYIESKDQKEAKAQVALLITYWDNIGK